MLTLADEGSDVLVVCEVLLTALVKQHEQRVEQTVMTDEHRPLIGAQPTVQQAVQLDEAIGYWLS